MASGPSQCPPVGARCEDRAPRSERGCPLGGILWASAHIPTLPAHRRNVPGRWPPAANSGGAVCGGSRPSSRQCRSRARGAALGRRDRLH